MTRVYAASTLIGTIVGGGIFGLPYAVERAGAVWSLALFVLVGAAVLFLHLLFGELVFRTEGRHRLVGYAALYLGPAGRWLAVFSTTVGVWGTILAYVILGGLFAEQLFGVSAAAASFVFWAFLSLLVVFGIQLIARAEVLLNLGVFAAVLVLLAALLPHAGTAPLPQLPADGAFLGYGVMLFAFMGLAAVPEVADFFSVKKDRRSLAPVILVSSLLVVALYAAFAFLVVSVTGQDTTQEALIGLAPFVGTVPLAAGVLFGLLSVAASFLVLANYIKNTFRHDMDLPYGAAALLALLVPLALFYSGVREFVPVIGAVGAVAGSVDGILVVLCVRKARERKGREPEYRVPVPGGVLWLLLALLALGAAAYLYA